MRYYSSRPEDSLSRDREHILVQESYIRRSAKIHLKVFHPKVWDEPAAIAFSQQGTTHIRGSCQDLYSLEGLSN